MNATLPSADSIHRILVIRWSALGDVATASAALEDLAQAFPEAVIDFNTMPPWGELFENDPRLNRVISIPLRARGNQLSATRRWLRKLRRGRYDLIVDLQSNDRSRLLLSISMVCGIRTPWRLGLKPGFPYNLTPARALEKNAALRQRSALAAAGVEPRTRHPVLHESPAHREAVRRLQAECGLHPRHYGLLLPGSQAAGFLKRWGARNYIALARALIQRGWVDKLALIGAGDEAEECDQIQRHCDSRLVNLCGRLEVAQIAPLARDARFVVANDTGTAHLAAAANVPLVMICGPTDPRRVRPGGEQVRTLQAEIHCVSCYRKTCSHHACMTLISPMRVMETLEALLV